MGAGLRGKYGISALENAIHRADSEEGALHECLLVAPHLIRNVLKKDLIRRFRVDKATIGAYLPALGIPYTSFDEDKFWETASAAMQMFLVRNHFYNT
ncbi:hypothetical protein A2982_03760 [candidate division WWE3 bacterium RIFCSPLOWO2_01_FULL_39_13]|uniref:Nucleoside diphosphate kinase-like domain-containing protein n=1 Tax=candidate division WWE3 bacterium RIFCSPLOWO2_01_FULL_39_13 TaxID=1802624 RepID=A0A1F4V4F4_UNCKA|nr:MAG: hypothetical protein A2982_03760 [candidate division WWE3 bacterium RIFCSPLOWO2_01_FULL_39_13]